MKILQIVILSLISFQTFGQFTKGDKVLSGSFNLGSQRTTEKDPSGYYNKSNSFGIGPTFGVLLTKNLELGVRSGYLFETYESKITNTSVNKTFSQILSFGIYGQKYYPIVDKFLFSLVAAIDYGYINGSNKLIYTNPNSISESESNTQNININLNPKFTFFPSNRWALQFSFGNIGFSTKIYKRSNSTDYSNYGFYVNYGTINLGLAYYFRKKKELIDLR